MDSTSSTQQEGQDTKQISVRFRRAENARHLPVCPDVPFAVPAGMDRGHLSNLINEIAPSTTPRIYEFFINNNCLRTTIHKYLLKNGLSGEAELLIEYTEATPEPTLNNKTPNNDWLSTIDAGVGAIRNDTQQDTFIATGGFDSALRIWSHPIKYSDKAACNPIISKTSHTHTIKSVRVARPLYNEKPAVLITGSQDRTVRSWDFIPQTKDTKAELNLTGIFHHHTGTVEAVETAFSPNRDRTVTTKNVRFLTGSYDSTVALWEQSPSYELSTEESEAILGIHKEALGRSFQKQQQQQKKVKTIKNSDVHEKSEDEQVKQYRPIQIYEHHKGPVSSVCWPDSSVLYSAGFDHTIYQVDLSSGDVVHKFHSGHVMTCIDFSLEKNLILSGEQTGNVCLWDPRIASSKNSSLSTSPKSSFRASKEWIAQVKWSPKALGSPDIFATASYDGKIKYWDIRSNQPLHTVESNSKCLYALDWSPIISKASSQTVGTWAYVGGKGKTMDRISWTLGMDN